jgi:hypothetical protein
MDRGHKFSPYPRIRRRKQIYGDDDFSDNEENEIMEDETQENKSKENEDVDMDMGNENSLDKKELPENEQLPEEGESSSKNNLPEKKSKFKVSLDSPTPVAPHMSTWYRLFPGVDPNSIVPKRTNPGPGFNVPGGEVPIRDEICKCIDYNSHILNQFKKMDLETTIEQRNNNRIYIQAIETKIEFAKNKLSTVPETPTTEYDVRLKNQILRDLEKLNRDKFRAEARIVLHTSRIEFIESQINKK